MRSLSGGRFPAHDSLCPSSLVNNYTFYFCEGDWGRGSSKCFRHNYAEEFENETITGHFRFVLEENSARVIS